jgi:type II pantothenate kinase
MTLASKPPAGIRAAGADVGTTLVKLALRDASGATRFDHFPAADLARAAAHLHASRPERIGVTGGGAPRLERLLDSDTARVDEFAAWAAGARRMLRDAGSEPERFLLVSVGTGTSVMLVEAEGVRRLGGTPLGGGSVMGLGRVLLGTADFDEIVRLAGQGDRRSVDLLIADVYPEGGFLLPPEASASYFARLARLPDSELPGPPDLAAALMGFVGESVALLSCTHANAQGVVPIVFGGSTLRENPMLALVLRLVCLALGRQPTFLQEGEFAGALGALESVAEGNR